MRLKQLLAGILVVDPAHDVEITGLAQDSRLVKRGDLFFARRGTQLDGKSFIAEAIKNGAAAILTEASVPSANKKIPQYQLNDLVGQIGIIAACFYGHPSRHMKIIGITGTNGKTSCSHFIAQALHHSGIPCGVMGTIGNGLAGAPLQHAALTTEDPIRMQALLAQWLKQGVKHVAMEASSHGLAQQRLNGIEFAVAVLTNLTRDHLDYHGDMAGYAAAKRLLFARPELQQIVLNIDDEYGRKWFKEFRGHKPIFAYSAHLIPEELRAILRIEVHHSQFDRVGFTAGVHTPWGEGVLHNPSLIGHFNLSNLLAVLAVLGILGLPLQTILTRLAELRGVPGRMQTLGGGKLPLVVVDYAHTPDALEQVLSALRKQASAKLWCVFGCGGDRDRGKRPLMAKVVEQYADFVIVTDDNPRHEDPRQIVREIMQGLENPAGAVIEHDRRRAIAHALSCAHADDIVLIAGKGHETQQIIGDEKMTFSDVLEAQLVLNEL